MCVLRELSQKQHASSFWQVILHFSVSTKKLVTVIFVVLLVLADVKNGNVSVPLSCTDTQQSFNRPRKHKSSPVKASQLGKGMEDLCDPPFFSVP